VYVFGCAVHLYPLCLEIGTDLLENGFESLEGVSVKYVSSILCYEDQMDM